MTDFGVNQSNDHSQLQIAQSESGRGLSEQLMRALCSVEEREPSGWLADGGNDNKLGIMRVPETLFWAALLIQKVRETECISSKTACSAFIPPCGPWLTGKKSVLLSVFWDYEEIN